MGALTVRKKIIFSGITIALVIVVLGCAEAILRIVSPRQEQALVSTVTYDGIRWHKINRSFLKKYFSSSDVLIPELKEDQFRIDRTKNSIRIFCLGESSMFGVPYQITANIPGMIRKQLRHLYPDREVEVINAAASAINSSVILDLAGDITALEPDLVLVYLGHNEFYGPGGVGASWLEKKLPFLTDAKNAANSLALVRTIDSLTTSPKKASVREMTLMQQVSNDTKVPLASADAERVFSIYESNLRGMITLLQQKHIPVMFSTAASNLSFPPFEYASLGANSEGEIISTFRNGDATALEQRLTTLYSKDSTNAFVNYWLGQTEAKLGKFDEARRFLIRAKDEDLLKFRAPERTNAILRSVCRELHVPYIDADSLLRALSPHGISDSTLFWEHVHPNAYGYYCIASLFVSEMRSFNLLPPPRTNAPRQRLPFQTDSLSICPVDLAFGDRSMRNLTSHWPFRNYTVTPAVLNTADDVLTGIVENMYRSIFVWDEACYRSAEHFERLGKMREAQTTYEAVLEEYPYNFYARYRLGSLFNLMGRPKDAIREFDAALVSNPAYTHARVERGLTNVNFGRLDAALADFEEAGKLDASGETSAGASIAYGKAVVYANKKQYALAMKYIDEALELAPGYGSAMQLRARVMAAMK
jgi:tetratricopeptide (TPR) repeat protein